MYSSDQPEVHCHLLSFGSKAKLGCCYWSYITKQSLPLCVPVQVMSDNHSGVLKLVAGFSDSLLSLQRETDSLRSLKSELSKDSTLTGNAHAHTRTLMHTQVNHR